MGSSPQPNYTELHGKYYVLNIPKSKKGKISRKCKKSVLCYDFKLNISYDSNPHSILNR